MNPSSSELKAWDLAHNIHPFGDFKKEKIIMDRAEGYHVWDSDGKKYVDGIGGLWCVNIGHGRKELAETMKEQAEQLAYYSPFVIFSSPPSAKLSKKICDMAPGNLNHVYFATSGSEANDLTVRMVHNYFNLTKRPYKKHIISRVNAYHGMTYMAASISGIAFNNINYDTENRFIHHLSTPNTYRPPVPGMSDEEYVNYLGDEFEQMIHRIGPHNVALFFAEPIMGAGGAYVAPKGYHQRMSNICKQYEILYVSDEVVTAFNRLGHFFASESVFGVKPDIINTAKGITSGYVPLSATIFSDEIFEGISKGVFTTGYTYSGHPIATAVALKNIEIMERENLGDHVLKISKILFDGLNGLKSTGVLGDVRGGGMMIGLEFVKNQETKELFHEDIKFTNRISDHCLADGLIMRPLGSGICILSPPLVWDEAAANFAISTIGNAIEKTLADIKKEGLV